MDGDVVFRTDPSNVFRVGLRELMHLSKDLLETGWRRDLENGQRLVSRVRDAMSDSLWNVNGDTAPRFNLVILKRDLSAAGDYEEHLLRFLVVVDRHHGAGVE